MVRLHHRVDIEEVSVEEFAKLHAEAVWVEQYRADLLSNSMLKVLSKVL